jgi:hypothetical protein
MHYRSFFGVLCANIGRFIGTNKPWRITTLVTLQFEDLERIRITVIKLRNYSGQSPAFIKLADN